MMMNVFKRHSSCNKVPDSCKNYVVLVPQRKSLAWRGVQITILSMYSTSYIRSLHPVNCLLCQIMQMIWNILYSCKSMQIRRQVWLKWTVLQYGDQEWNHCWNGAERWGCTVMTRSVTHFQFKVIEIWESCDSLWPLDVNSSRVWWQAHLSDKSNCLFFSFFKSTITDYHLCASSHLGCRKTFFVK